MRKKRSKYSNENYPNLYRIPDQPCWIFRKYSSEKRKEFYCSTGLDSTDKNAPAAYKIGLAKFNEWMGAFLPTDTTITLRDLGRALLASRDNAATADNTYRTIQNQLENHILPAFGSLRPDQLTAKKWREYENAERARPRQRIKKNGDVVKLPPRKALFNTHKVLMQILHLAKEEKLIQELPTLELADPEAAPPRYIPKEEVLRIIRMAGRIDSYVQYGTQSKPSRYHSVALKLLVLIMWKQGARPSEILQYRWEMINFRDGTIHIPAEISKNRKSRTIPMNLKVLRVCKFLHARSKSPWIFPSPTREGQPIRSCRSAWESVMERLGFDYDLYNLRDTWITDRLRAGLSAVFIGKYCQNSAQMIERRYAVAQEDVMKSVAGC